ncbi:hypothetical protein Droror1_Dr00008355 [Drosera rotundifolia]
MGTFRTTDWMMSEANRGTPAPFTWFYPENFLSSARNSESPFQATKIRPALGFTAFPFRYAGLVNEAMNYTDLESYPAHTSSKENKESSEEASDELVAEPSKHKQMKDKKPKKKVTSKPVAYRERRNAFEIAFRHMYGLPSSVDALPPMREDGGHWSALYSWMMPTRSFLEFVMFASHLLNVASPDLKPFTDPNSKIQDLKEGLESKDWVRVCQSLNDVRVLAIYHSVGRGLMVMYNYWEKAISVLVKEMKNPRSAVCKTSIMASSDVFGAYGNKLLQLDGESDGFDQLELLFWVTISEITIPSPNGDKVTFKSSAGPSRMFPAVAFVLERGKEVKNEKIGKEEKAGVVKGAGGALLEVVEA